MGRQIQRCCRVLGAQKGHEAGPAAGIRVWGRRVGIGLVEIAEELVVLLVMVRLRVREILGGVERVGPGGRRIRGGGRRIRRGGGRRGGSGGRRRGQARVRRGSEECLLMIRVAG